MNIKHYNLNKGKNQKFAHDFCKINKTMEFDIYIALSIEEKTGVNLLLWTKKILVQYLKEFDSTSPISLQSKLYSLRQFNEYICKEMNISYKDYETYENIFYDCINIEKLLAITINEDQYNTIKNQLNLYEDGTTYNTRDKLIFELAWSGLTSDEIKNIKISDVRFEKEDSKEIALIHIEGQEFEIFEPEIVEDIKKVMNETHYLIFEKNTRVRKMSFRDSEYLIRPVNIGSKSIESCVLKPALTLKNVMNNVLNPITCNGINITELSIEDIRRSRIIQYFHLYNKNEITTDEIIEIFNIKKSCNIAWLSKVAKLKYPD